MVGTNKKIGVNASVSVIGRGAFAVVTFLLAGSAWAATTLISADVFKPDHPAVKTLEHVAQSLATKSGGDLALQVKANGELGTEAEILDKLRKGTLDMGRVSVAALADKIPLAKLLSLPYLFRSRDHVLSTLRGDFGSRFDAELLKNGLVLVSYLDTGKRSFYARKSLRNHNDFKGFKFRVEPATGYKDLITDLGGTPITISADKVTEALRDGDIDGAEGSILWFISSEHYKQAKFMSLDEHCMLPDVVLMSKKAWDKLKAPQQESLKMVFLESEDFSAKLLADKEREGLAFLKKNGVSVVSKSQISMEGIESYALRLYSRFAQDPKDLDVVMQILSSK